MVLLGSNNGSVKNVNTVALVECGAQRTVSRSISWNCTGSCLGVASSDRMVRLLDLTSLQTATTSSNPAAREILTITGHTAPVLKVLFHPDQKDTLCTSAADATVRLWDVRNASQRATGQIQVQHGQGAVAVEWSPATGSHVLAVTERNGSVYIYDTRKLASPAPVAPTAARGRRPTNNALCTYNLSPYLAESCIFSPTGSHLVAGCTLNGQGMSSLRIWPWKEGDKDTGRAAHASTANYPAHAGPIYSLKFSPDGKRLATGGADAIVGIFDTKTMCCERTIVNKLKFIRSVAFSHDSRLLAVSTEEDGVDIADASTGVSAGTVHMTSPVQPRSGGAEEVAFHPKEYLLACARTDNPLSAPTAPVTVAKLSITT